MLDARLIRLSPKAHRFPTGFMVYPAASRHAVFWMLDWAASFDLWPLTSTLGVGLRLVEHYGSERRSSFAFATARQVSACYADSSRRSLGVDGSSRRRCVGRLLRSSDSEHEHEQEKE